MDRRRFLKTTLLLGSAACIGPRVSGLARAAAPEVKFDADKPFFAAPGDSSSWPEFRRTLAAWRNQRKRELNYSDRLYQREDFRWVPANFACCFVMLCDETFYDPGSGRYTVRKFLKQVRRDFGGCDSVVLWHAYPRIGFDDRNQFDFYRDLPGGLVGLRAAIRQLHQANVRAFIDYNPWDTGTRREGKDDLDALVEMVGALEADGIFLDTMDRGSELFRRKLDAVRKGVVLEGEDALPLDRVRDHHMSWAQWFVDSPVPGVLRNKWFERRHMQHQIQRWNRDHTDELHSAWMNGSGMLIWENVFGTWNGWSDRDRSILRAMLPIQRRFVSLFSGENWTPLVTTLMTDVYASLWEGQGIRLWTLVNRSKETREGPWIRLECNERERVFDLMAGREVRLPGGAAVTEVGGSLRPRGVGCVVTAQQDALGDDFPHFLREQRTAAGRASWNATPIIRHMALQPAPRTRALSSRAVPPGMIEIPAGKVRLRTEFRVRECGFYDSTDAEFEKKFPTLHLPRVFEREVSLQPYAIDVTPVTNAQFAEFLRASGYWPRHKQNFLRQWIHGAPPPGKEEHPVVYVDLEDARAYARWKHRRLPTEDEWQYAAQGDDGRKYPWGNEMLPDRCNEGTTGGTTAVRTFPQGRSPFGVYDLCGNVWEWTESERSDGRTRFCILHGGSFYRAQGSDWYADGGPRSCDFAAKFLLFWPGLDRCATIGFRCVVNLSG